MGRTSAAFYPDSSSGCAIDWRPFSPAGRAMRQWRSGAVGGGCGYLCGRAAFVARAAHRGQAVGAATSTVVTGLNTVPQISGPCLIQCRLQQRTPFRIRAGTSPHLIGTDPEWGALLQSTLDQARPADLRHGVQSSYNRGCRCTDCMAAMRRASRRRRSATQAPAPTANRA